ncbi:MAG: PKD domain-containing protein [Gemmatimonadaceae bacterium]
MFRTLLGTFFFIGALACSTEPLAPLPLEVTLQASRTTAIPGDTITFVADAQGGSLVGLEISYGDNTSEAFSTAGARTARVTFKHAYLQRATYSVRVVVTDAVAGSKDASIEVRVN